MKVQRWWCVCLLLWMAPGWSRPVWPTPQQIQTDAEQFAYDRIGDGKRLLLGPAAPRILPVDPSRSCADLYAERLQLLQAQYDYKPAYTDDPRNRAAVFIGTIFSPAFYYLAFSGIQAYNDANADAAIQGRIDALRNASATRMCFVK